MGITKCGIRLDSGDLTYLSQKAREMLDEAGLTECKIFASNALDEYIIRDLVRQGARIDSFGVGERLITSRSEPVFGGCTSWWPSRTMREISSPRSRSVRTPPRSPPPTLRRSTASSPGIPARRKQI